MEKYVVDFELMQGILNYMAQRPYAEVFQLVDQIRSLKGIPVAPPVKPQLPEAPAPVAPEKSE